MTTTEELERLASSTVFQGLAEVPRLSLLRVLEVRRDELLHSRLLASVLDPRRHRHAAKVLEELLSGLTVVEPTIGTLLQVLRGLGSVNVREERSFLLRDRTVRIDVWIELKSKDGNTVVLAVENKVDAAERVNQLSDYQEVIERQSRNGVLLFLTPSGRAGVTLKADHGVPCIEIGYELVAKALATVAAQLDPGDRAPLEDLAQYWKESFVENNELKEKVRRLWKEHGKAAGLLLAHRPRLHDIRDAYERALSQEAANRRLTTSFSHWPEQRRKLEEIKCTIPAWTANGLRLTVMLYSKPGEVEYGSGRPCVQLVISADEYEKASSNLRALAERSNGNVDSAFSPLRHWPHWRRVLKSPPLEPAGDDLSFDEDVTRKCVAASCELIDAVLPYMP